MICEEDDEEALAGDASCKKKRKNLQVKIRLPLESMHKKLEPRKERSLQKCCLVFFLLVLFMLATGILIYFFGKRTQLYTLA